MTATGRVHVCQTWRLPGLVARWWRHLGFGSVVELPCGHRYVFRAGSGGRVAWVRMDAR